MTLASSSGPVVAGSALTVSESGAEDLFLGAPSNSSGRGFCWSGGFRSRHHPTALVLTLGLEVEHALLFQQLEGRIPEVQVEDLALARQEVVFDVEAVHGLEMPPQHCSGNEFGDLGFLVAALLDGVQRIQARLQMLLVLLVPLRNTGVEVPTVIIEARSRGDQVDNVLLRLVLDLGETHDHVSNLYAGVVDVVLDVDGVAGGA